MFVYVSVTEGEAGADDECNIYLDADMAKRDVSVNSSLNIVSCKVNPTTLYATVYIVWCKQARWLVAGVYGTRELAEVRARLLRSEARQRLLHKITCVNVQV